MRALSSDIFGVIGHVRYIIGQLNIIYLITKALKNMTSRLAQSVESLTLTPDFAGSRPVGATIFFCKLSF